LSWHRKYHSHPIFNPEYARENLVSLVETLVMFYIYSLIISLVIFLFATIGFVETDSMLVLYAHQLYGPFIVQTGENSVAVCLITILIYSVIALIIRESFEVYKATQHPKE